MPAVTTLGAELLATGSGGAIEAVLAAGSPVAAAPAAEVDVPEMMDGTEELPVTTVGVQGGVQVEYALVNALDVEPTDAGGCKAEVPPSVGSYWNDDVSGRKYGERLS